MTGAAIVRRLVFDIPLKWLCFAALFSLMIPLMDSLWLLRGTERMPLIVTFYFGGATIALATIKLPVWRLLPISDAQIAHAQWWLVIGAPTILMTIGLLATMAVMRVFGWLHASILDAAILLAGQFAVCVAFPAVGVATAALTKKVGVAASIVLAMLALLALLAVTIQAVLTPVLRLALPAAGLVALALAASAYALARPYIPRARAFGNAPSASGPTKPLRPGPKGWAGLALIFARTMAMAVGLSVTGLFVMRHLLNQGDHADHVSGPISMTIACATLIVLPIALSAQARMSIRVLRGVTTGGRLAVILQGICAASMIVAGGILFAVCALAGVSTQALPATLALVLGVSGCLMPMMFRISSPIWIGLAMVLPIAVLMPLSALIDVIPSAGAYIIAGGLALMLAGWLWTAWELTYGRAAYRPWPMAVMTWRGVGG